MEKVVVGVDGSPASRAGVQWCVEHVDRDAEIVAVCGLSAVGEFVIDLPGFDASSPEEIRAAFQRTWCAPLEQAGFNWRAAFVHRSHASALAGVIEDTHPDLVVIGKPDHVAFDVLLGGKLQHTLHTPTAPS